MKRIICNFLFIVCACVLSSCQSYYDSNRAPAQPISDFLPNKDLLRECNSRQPFHFVYIDEEAPVYKHVYVAPIDISALENDPRLKEFVGNSNGVFKKELHELTAYTQNAFRTAIKNYDGKTRWYLLSDTPEIPECYTLELAIVRITPAKGGWNIFGVAVDWAIGVGSLLTSEYAYGSLTIEARIRDSRTGKIHAMFATTERDEAAVLGNYSNFTWLSSAKTNAKNIAGYTAEFFNTERYEDTKHHFPLQWIVY